MKWKIKNIEIKNQVGLSPMAGISNPSYFKILEDMDLGFAITELISAEAIVRDNKKTFDMLNGFSDLKIPVGIQIFGNNATVLSKAAKIIEDTFKPAFIDINMGCPVPKVVNSGSGSALLKDLDKIREIVSTVSKSINIPLTVKIRSGWDQTSINAVEVAKVIEESGASAITIHARTKSQGYSGKANWDIIKEVKENTHIPIIGNGDITSPEKALEMIKYTKCDAIAIGRSALGNPWLIKQTVDYLNTSSYQNNIDNIDKVEMMKKHYKLLKKYKNEHTALLEIRTNILYYLKGMPLGKDIKNKVMLTKTEDELISVLNEYEEYLKEII